MNASEKEREPRFFGLENDSVIYWNAIQRG